MKTFLLFALLSFTHACLADESEISFGGGIGTSYSGLGVNVSLLTQTEKKYLSTGCVSYGPTSGATCGVGIGWISTEAIDFGSNKHGLGLYLGVVGTDHDNGALYGLGVGYHYFFQGIDKSGAHLGISLVQDKEKHHNSTGFMIELGYQF